MEEPTGADAGVTPATPAAPTAGATTPGGEEQALATAKGLVDRGAPWKAGMTWQVVLAEGIVLALLGAFVWLRPGVGARAALQIMGVLLLVTAAISVWRLLRDQIEPVRIANVGFRAGVGMSIGLITVIGSLVANEGDTVTVALAVVLGIGLILYALAALAAALLRREPGARFPIVAVVIAALIFVVGLLLVANGRSIDSLKDTFTWLGILVLVVGIALVGYALLMRSRVQVEPAE